MLKTRSKIIPRHRGQRHVKPRPPASAFEQLEPRFLFASAQTLAPAGDIRVDSLLAGPRWDVPTITYSFFSGGSYYGSTVDPRPVSDVTQGWVRYILNDLIAPMVNVKFQEVPDTPTSYGLMRYLDGTLPRGVSGRGSYPGKASNDGTASDRAGDVTLNSLNDRPFPAIDVNNSFPAGPSYGAFTVLIHETLHALGLKHPGNYDGTSGGTPPFLPAEEDNRDNTVMTYNDVCGSYPVTPMPYDLLALQSLYGANTSTRAGNTTYAFTYEDFFSSSDLPGIQFGDIIGKSTIWDGGGIDTIDLSQLRLEPSGGFHVDIQPGGWIAANAGYRTKSYDIATVQGGATTFVVGVAYHATNNGTRIAIGTTIENVIASRSNDDIYLNSVANRVSGYTPGTPAGQDVIWNADSQDTLDLTAFGLGGVTTSRLDDDLVIGLGGSNSVTIKDYYQGRAMQIAFAEIGVEATDLSAAEGWPVDPGTFTLTRSGSTALAQTVFVTLDGTAINGLDYQLIDSSVTFVAGAATANVRVVPRNDRIVEPLEVVTLRIAPGKGYSVNAANSASVTIADHYGMRLAVKFRTGIAIDIYAVAQSTIDDIQQQIAFKTGISPQRQRPVFGGKMLEGGRTLSDYNLQRGSVIYLINYPNRHWFVRSHR